MGINNYYNDNYSQDDVDDKEYENINYYYDLLTGLAPTKNTIKSRTVRLYRKLDEGSNNTKNYFIISFPYADEHTISVNTTYGQASASWSEKISRAFTEGLQSSKEFLSQIIDIINTTVNNLGVQFNGKDAEDALRESFGKITPAANGTVKGRTDYIKQFEDTQINITDGLNSLMVTLLSCDSLLNLLNSGRCGWKDCKTNDKFKYHTSQIQEAIDNNQPVRAYLYYLLDNLGGGVYFKGSVKSDGEVTRSDSSGSDTNASAYTVGQFGMSKEDTKNAGMNPTWDFDKDVLYAICGDSYIVKNLVCTNLLIKPSTLLTVDNDYYSANVSVTLVPARIAMSHDLDNWLSYKLNYDNNSGKEY